MELLLILGLTLLNGLFATSEIAIVSARKIRLQQMTEDRVGGAKTALELANAPNNFLSTVQIGITLINILLGVFSGGSIAQFLNTNIFQTIPFLAPYGETLSTAVVVLCLMYFSIVLGELVPKRLAIQNPERIAILVARPMLLLSRLTAPLVKLLSVSTQAVLTLLGVRASETETVTEAELLSMVEQGVSFGTFEVAEHNMIEGVLRLDSLRIAEIMTPRVDTIWIEINASQHEIRGILSENTFDYYPIAQATIDNVIGVVSAKDLLHQILHGGDLDLRALMRTPIFLPESATAARMLETFKKSHIHLGIVIGEHGGVEGVVTVTDIFEEIVGGMDVDEADAVQRHDGSWLLDGSLPAYRLEEIFDSVAMPEDEAGEYLTLAGFVMFRLEHIPHVSERFDWHGLTFEVVDMDGNQIDKILVRTAESV
jgi:putative hemolysin